MKKNVVFFLTLGLMLIFATPVLAIQLDNPLGGVGDFPTLIAKIAEYISGLVAALAVLMFVWAAVLFTTSAGNESKIGAAKKVLIYAVIGAAIALAGGGLIELIKNIIGA